MTNRTRERSRGPLWRWPAVGAVAALVVTLPLTTVRPRSGLWQRAWLGDTDAASAVLQVLATSVITVLGLTFSLTVVALQLASQQFSPRLLREFTRDPVTKGVLTVFITTLMVCVTTLGSLRQSGPTPTPAVLLGLLLGLASVAAALGFITHIARAIRVDTIMAAVHAETHRTMMGLYPPYEEQPDSRWDGDPATAKTLLSSESGFVNTIDVDALIRAADETDARLSMLVRCGDLVTRGTPMAEVWVADRLLDDLREKVQDAMGIGRERTLDMDVAFGFRQLEDIAVKAMSPAINDPVTAAHAVGHMGDLLVALMGRRVGATTHRGEGSVPRVLMPDRNLRYYFTLMCAQLSRYGAKEPTVLAALLRAIRDAATACRDDDQRNEVRRAADLVVAALEPDLPGGDSVLVADLRRRIERALDGRVRDAYADEAGETRSL